jgi:hypothetical protein
MAKLRGHHLICLHFYEGEGYDRPFIDSLEKLIEEIETVGVEVAEGADDVCEPCPHRSAEACTMSATADREIREMDARALALLDLPVGRKADWAFLRESVSAVFPEWYENYCFACNWRPACEKKDLFRQLKVSREK